MNSDDKKERKRIADKRYREKHRDSINARRREWYRNNKERVKLHQIRYYEKLAGRMELEQKSD